MNITTSKRLEGVGEYYFSKKLAEIDAMRAAGRKIISLGVGSPDRPPHQSVVETLYSEATKPSAHGYQSYKGAAALREGFSKWYKQYYDVDLNPATEILPLIGSKEGLMHIFMTYLSEGDKVLVPNPGYPTYRSAATLAEATVCDYILSAENDWQPDFDAIERAGLDGVKIMVINYPHMPTGATPKETLFADLVAFAKKHSLLLVHDNPYSFIRNKRPQSILAVEGAKDVVLELNSLSKSHNMPGWRVGAIMGSAERITEVLRFKSNMDSGMFLPLQLAAAKALELDKSWYDANNAAYYEREALGYEIMSLLGCEARPNQAGLFIWGRLPETAPDCYTFIDDILERKGVFITPGAIFGSEGERYIRISLCADKKVLEEVVSILKEKE